MKVRPRKRRINGRIYRDFVVDLGLVIQPDGEKKRTRRIFPDAASAEKFLAEKKDLRALHGDAALALAPEVALRYSAIERRLAAAGATIEQAADYYLANHRPVKERVTIGVMLDRCVLDMELRSVAGNTIATFKCACLSFVSPRADRMPETIETREIKEWIYGNGWHPKTMRGYITALSTFFSFGVREGYAVKSPLQPDTSSGRRRSAIVLPKLVKKEPRIFVVAQVRRLFLTVLTKHELGVDADAGGRGQVPVYRRLLGFLALATFCGVRPHELVRLEVAAIDLDARTVTLDAAVAKTSDRRVVNISANCVRWLRLWTREFPQYKHVAPPNWDRLMKKLRTAAGLRPWPHDVLRHCFASYFHALHGDKKLLQNQMGHSENEDTLDSNYRAVRGPDGKPVNKTIARGFWGITPAALFRVRKNVAR